jgi:trehalose 6-phosphate synthase
VTERRLIVVSNRVPPPPAGDGPWPAGGLVSALLPALLNRGRALWFGWTGDVGDPERGVRVARADGVEFVTLDLTEHQVSQYYDGFCNGVLWPAMHGLGDRDRHDASTFGTYRSVNRLFASTLLPLLRPDDLVWVHDYHLLAVGRDLRRLGWTGPIGYFHHTPVPDRAGSRSPSPSCSPTSCAPTT